MPSRGELYKCHEQGMLVEVIQDGQGDFLLHGKPMDKLTENTTDAAQEKHVPVIELVDCPDCGEKVVKIIGRNGAVEADSPRTLYQDHVAAAEMPPQERRGLFSTLRDQNPICRHPGVERCGRHRACIGTTHRHQQVRYSCRFQPCLTVRVCCELAELVHLAENRHPSPRGPAQ